MQTAEIIIRKMQTADIDAAMTLSMAEGWNQTQNDWSFFINDAASVTVGAEYNGQIIGTTAAVNYSGKMVWIGMVLVHKAYRGKGISKLLLNHILETTQDIAPAKLDATIQGQQVYAKLGFEEEYRIARLINPAVAEIAIQDAGTIPTQFSPDDLSEVLKMDASVFGADRSRLLTIVAGICPHKAWVIKKDNRITGFALGRNGSKYHHIGPVAAGTTTDARLLIAQALRHLHDCAAVIDVLCDKEELIALLTHNGFSIQRYFTRMYRINNPCEGITERMFAAAGPEFG